MRCVHATPARGQAIRLGAIDLMACLSDAERDLVSGRPAGVRRNALLRALACNRLGVDARDKWVNGIEHLRKMLTRPRHFVDLLAVAARGDVYDVLDLVDEIDMGQHEKEKTTDPRLYRILHDAADAFKAHGYDALPHDEIMNLFEARMARMDAEASPEQRLSALTRRARLAKCLSQERLAMQCGLSRRAVVKLEQGDGVSGRSVARVLDSLGMLDVLDAGVRRDSMRQRAPMRRRARVAPQIRGR